MATYRLQLHQGFTFEDAQAWADYLKQLGVSDCYLSPILEARKGSSHGYDIVDPTTVRGELGGEPALIELHQRLAQSGMGILLDIVPNHMCVAGGENAWWDDVLRHGRASPYARFFDIYWGTDGGDGPETTRDVELVLPFLGTSLDEALAGMQIRVARAGGDFFAVCGGLRFPLAAESWTHILEPAARRLERQKKPDASELRHLLADLAHVPSPEPKHVSERRRDAARLQERLAHVIRTLPNVREAVDACIDELNECKGEPSELERILSEQIYRLADWREGGRWSSYRRFFDVNELAAVRIEDPEVFHVTHGKILELVGRGIVTGLRVDHVDGLRDPTGYLAKLPENHFVIVEKILEGAERVRADWSVDGTTGYEFLNAVNGLWVDRLHEERFLERYASFIGDRAHFDDVVYRCKRLVVETSFAGDVRRLTELVADAGAPGFGGASKESLARAFAELAACFPVYRSYARADDDDVSRDDRGAILMAVGRAKDRAPGELGPLLDAIGELLQLAGPRGPSQREVVLRFQQLTGAVMAKGFEDTALYRYVPLASLNEVGGNPERFGVDVDAFHRLNQDRRKHWPRGLSATSTHDTKRSEDVRARLGVLSELGDAWWDAVSAWRQLNRRHRSPEIDPNDEYLLYQTIVGAWPPEVPDEAAHEDFVSRIQAYMRKALREAKVRSSWIRPDEGYEDALSEFIACILDTSRGAPFLEALTSFLPPVLDAGFMNSISQVLLKIGSAGIPDFYQGTELWDYSLVDPDNRRPVDFESRRRALTALDETIEPHESDNGKLDALIGRMLDALNDGRLKLFVTSRGLRFRQAHPELFERGDYVPLETTGARKDHVVAFARKRGDDAVIVAAGRFFTRLPTPATRAAWLDTRLKLGGVPGEVFHDVFTRREVRVQEETLPLDRVFSALPVSLLERTR